MILENRKMNKIYVGNLPYGATEDELEGLFSENGQILNINIIKDRETGRSKGFAFVEFSTDEQVQQAVKLDGFQLQGRPLKVSAAREQQRSGGGGGARREREQW
jgi:RNA recognition motif-containing protein